MSTARVTNYTGGNDASFAITADKATTAVVPFNGLAGGVFLVPAASGLTSLVLFGFE